MKDLTGLEGKERLEQHAINKTVNRVHQAMEAFIHNMNTIHSRGGNQVVFLLSIMVQIQVQKVVVLCERFCSVHTKV